MKRIITILCVLAVVVICACPAFAVTLESSVTSGDTITDTYTVPVTSIFYEDPWNAETITGDNFTIFLPEGDYAYAEVYYEGFNLDITDDFKECVARFDVYFSIIGGVRYEGTVEVGNGTGFYPLSDNKFSGEVYESDELQRITVNVPISAGGEVWIQPELYIDFHSYSGNFYVEFDSVKVTIVRNRVDRYEPDYTVPGDGIGEELDKVEQDAIDKVQDGADAFEDLHLGVVDTILTYATSFLAVGALLDVFLEIDFLDNIFTISLAVGSFALLLGLAIGLTRGKE